MILDPPSPFDSEQEWQDFADEIQRIIRDKGRAIMQADLDAIETALAAMPAERRYALEPWIYEGLALIVNDTLYEGDIAPID